MSILEEVVEHYLRDLRETGRLLAVLCRVLDPVVLEVGTAIGYSTPSSPLPFAAGDVPQQRQPPLAIPTPWRR